MISCKKQRVEPHSDQVHTPIITPHPRLCAVQEPQVSSSQDNSSSCSDIDDDTCISSNDDTQDNELDDPTYLPDDCTCTEDCSENGNDCTCTEECSKNESARLEEKIIQMEVLLKDLFPNLCTDMFLEMVKGQARNSKKKDKRLRRWDSRFVCIQN